jgi:hypothetical protein
MRYRRDQATNGRDQILLQLTSSAVTPLGQVFATGELSHDRVSRHCLPERRHVVTTQGSLALRRIAGALFLISALTFATAATILSATFDWPDILREPADVVLTRFASGGPSLVWTWFATAWTYAILVVPILLLPTVLGRRDDVALWVATFAGAISVLLALIGFLRWVFVVPPLARMYQDADDANRAALAAAWLSQHQFGGALLGEHLGQLLAIGWSLTVSIIVIRTRVLPRWLGVIGLIVSVLYLFNQGDILATALPGFPVFDLAGLIGSTAWGLWVAALGITLLFRRSSGQRSVRSPEATTATT